MTTFEQFMAASGFLFFCLSIIGAAIWFNQACPMEDN